MEIPFRGSLTFPLLAGVFYTRMIRFCLSETTGTRRPSRGARNVEHDGRFWGGWMKDNDSGVLARFDDGLGEQVVEDPGGLGSL